MELLEKDEITNSEISRMEVEIGAEINDAISFAEAGEFEPFDDLMKDVYTGV